MGLATGPFCLGICAPVLIPYFLAEGKTGWWDNVKIVGEFLLGRFAAYLCVGALIGWAGGLVQLHLNFRVLPGAVGLCSILMLVYALSKVPFPGNFCRVFQGRWRVLRMPLLLGFLMGINICPPFLVALSRVLELGRVAEGTVFFTGFFAGTSLFVLPVLGMSPFTRSARVQRVGVLVTVLVALWFLLHAVKDLF